MSNPKWNEHRVWNGNPNSNVTQKLFGDAFVIQIQPTGGEHYRADLAFWRNTNGSHVPIGVYPTEDEAKRAAPIAVAALFGETIASLLETE